MSYLCDVSGVGKQAASGHTSSLDRIPIIHTCIHIEYCTVTHLYSSIGPIH